MSGGGRGYPLFAVGNVHAKWASRCATSSGTRLRGKDFAKGGGENFFGRRILGSEGRFGRIRVSTVVSARFWKKIIFGRKYFYILRRFCMDFGRIFAGFLSWLSTLGGFWWKMVDFG